MRDERSHGKLIEALLDTPLRRERYLKDAEFHAGIEVLAQLIEVTVHGLEISGFHPFPQTGGFVREVWYWNEQGQFVGCHTIDCKATNHTHHEGALG